MLTIILLCVGVSPSNQCCTAPGLCTKKQTEEAFRQKYEKGEAAAQAQPGAAPVTQPGAVAGTQPGAAPGAQPDAPPGVGTQGMQPGAAPGTPEGVAPVGPGTRPEASPPQPGAVPGTPPGAAPMQQTPAQDSPPGNAPAPHGATQVAFLQITADGQILP
ncbi:unnamed protein product [Amoebophrya sp. A25]|nr:unnamed protein product [Amoebophrya sp. A25]|eukprot:GSA25T00010489001.1